MVTVAILCALAGLVLGLSSNVRMFVLVVLLMVIAAFIAGSSQEGHFAAVFWPVAALACSQIGYIGMIVLRAAWSVAQARYRQPVAYSRTARD
jgi:hypothetical protein